MISYLRMVTSRLIVARLLSETSTNDRRHSQPTRYSKEVFILPGKNYTRGRLSRNGPIVPTGAGGDRSQVVWFRLVTIEV